MERINVHAEDLELRRQHAELTRVVKLLHDRCNSLSARLTILESPEGYKFHPDAVVESRG